MSHPKEIQHTSKISCCLNTILASRNFTYISHTLSWRKKCVKQCYILGLESIKGATGKTHGQSFYSVNMARMCHLTCGQRVVSGPILFSNSWSEASYELVTSILFSLYRKYIVCYTM